MPCDEIYESRQPSKLSSSYLTYIAGNKSNVLLNTSAELQQSCHIIFQYARI